MLGGGPRDELGVLLKAPSGWEAGSIGRPSQNRLDSGRVDRAVVDKWNDVALKEAAQGAALDLYEVDDVFIIDAGYGDGDQPFLGRPYRRLVAGHRLPVRAQLGGWLPDR